MAKEQVMWMVRAGHQAVLFDDFRSKNLVAIGWDALGDLSKVTDSDEVRNMMEKSYPDFSKGKTIMSASQVAKFRSDFEKGDYVVTYNPDERIYLVGEISSDYQFETKVEGYPHVRKVDWKGTIERDNLSTSARNTLGSISTIFEVNEDVQEEVLALLKGDKPVEKSESEQEDELEELKEDQRAKAHELIKDELQKLDWEEMQELVAGLLRAMGYKTRVSPKGADRGKDIQASPDGLGFEEPRILVEVKHRKGKMGSKEVRSMPGTDFHKRLYVSTGGFSKDALLEAERANPPITTLDLDQLAELVSQHYDNFDLEARRLIKLVKIYWPVG